MKLKDLIKDGWPVKRNASSYDFDSDWCDGFDTCLAANLDKFLVVGKGKDENRPR